MKKKVILSVTNDLVSDQRVHKMTTSLTKFGYEVTLVGREFKDSRSLNRDYKTNRFRLLFNTKVWFYAEYNIRLFFFLLFHNYDIYVANDLDTLLPNFLISKLKNKKLVYDSHELFCEVPELTSRPKIRKVWLSIEEWIFPKLNNVITVNSLIAGIYSNKYNVGVNTIRNIAPTLVNKSIDEELSKRVKGSNRMLILQGAGINKDRGAEEIVEAMQYIEGVILYIIGSGDVITLLKETIKDKKLTEKVKLLERMPYGELLEYTKIADIGVSLDKGTNDNYEYSLPNKVFDYMQAGIAILVSNRRVVSKLISDNDLGIVVDSHNPRVLAEKIKYMLSDEKQLLKWKQNSNLASITYCWENEEKELKRIYSELV